MNMVLTVVGLRKNSNCYLTVGNAHVTCLQVNNYHHPHLAGWVIACVPVHISQIQNFSSPIKLVWLPYKQAVSKRRQPSYKLVCQSCLHLGSGKTVLNQLTIITITVSDDKRLSLNVIYLYSSFYHKQPKVCNAFCAYLWLEFIK